MKPATSGSQLGFAPEQTPRGPTLPLPGYESIAGHVAFYPGRVDEAWVDGERVMPQAGDFYGGWITSEVTGPFKGGPDTNGW